METAQEVRSGGSGAAMGPGSALKADFTPRRKAGWQALVGGVSAVMKAGADELSEG